MQSAFAAAAASAQPNDAPWAMSYRQAEGVAPRRTGPVVKHEGGPAPASPNTLAAHTHINNLWQAATGGNYASEDGGEAEDDDEEEQDEEEEEHHRGKKTPGKKGSKQPAKKRTTGKGGLDAHNLKEQRMMKNRESAARSRLRRQQLLQGLEETNAALRAELDDARQQVAALTGQVADLEWRLQVARASPDEGAPTANRQHSVATGGAPTISGLPAAPSGLSNLSLPPLSTLIEQAMALPAGLLQSVMQGMHAEQGGAEQGDEGESGGLGQHGGGQRGHALKHERGEADGADGDREEEEEVVAQPPSKRQRHHDRPPRAPASAAAALALAAPPAMSGLAMLEAACEARAPSLGLGLGQSLRLDSIGSLDGLMAPAALAAFFAHEASRRGSSDAAC